MSSAAIHVLVSAETYNKIRLRISIHFSKSARRLQSCKKATQHVTSLTVSAQHHTRSKLSPVVGTHSPIIHRVHMFFLMFASAAPLVFSQKYSPSTTTSVTSSLSLDTMADELLNKRLSGVVSTGPRHGAREPC